MWRTIRRLMTKTLTPKETAAIARELLAKQVEGDVARIVSSHELIRSSTPSP